MSSGEVVMLAGNSGYQIIDCDLLGTAIIIHTGSNYIKKPGPPPQLEGDFALKMTSFEGTL